MFWFTSAGPTCSGLIYGVCPWAESAWPERSCLGWAGGRWVYRGQARLCSGSDTLTVSRLHTAQVAVGPGNPHRT